LLENAVYHVATSKAQLTREKERCSYHGNLRYEEKGWDTRYDGI